VRWTTIAIALLVACNDVRDFRGTWHGARVGDAEVLHVGAGDAATLSIDAIDNHGIQARLAIDNLLPETPITSIAGAEADAVSTMTFAGSPLRVFIAFTPLSDGGGDATTLIALYDDDRVEVRLLRGGTMPLYAIFTLRSG
jgi:hypothetical protein